MAKGSHRSARRLLLLSCAIACMLAPGAQAFEVPPAGDPLYIQTNGPNGDIGLGDWYTADAPGGGSGYHYLAFNVPCSWPAALPVHVDLFGAEMNGDTAATATSDEQNGAELDPTEFELYGPDAEIGPGYSNPAPGAGIGGTRTTFAPVAAGDGGERWDRFATLAAPVGCGQYLIRSQTKGTEADDQNGWRLRVGRDDDSNPNDAPPADYDNPDGLYGTDDELQAGTFQSSYQHDVPGTGPTHCQTIHEFVGDVSSAIFHNFDMDSNGRVRYYAPSDAYDSEGQTGGIAGTVSGNTVWNNGDTARGGDVIDDPEPGWWKVVTCISAHNQYIQEGQNAEIALAQDPLLPVIDVSKDDGVDRIPRGGSATYTIEIGNSATGPTAGAARGVEVDDTLPAGFTPTACRWLAPQTGSCDLNGQRVTAALDGTFIAGEDAALEIDYSVDADATGTLLNTAEVAFEDSLGNPFPGVVASDTDSTFVEQADLEIDKSHGGGFVYGEQGTYELEVTNNGPDDAEDVRIADALPAGLSYAGFTGPGWSCAAASGTVSCDRAAPLPNGASDTIQITVDIGQAAVPGVTNTASVSALTDDPDISNNDDSDPTSVVGASIGGTIFEDLDVSGSIDGGETGVPGWVAYVDLDGDGALDPGEPNDTTAADGTYAITGVASGTYTIRIEPQAGWTCSFPSPCSHSQQLTGGVSVDDLDFAVWEPGAIAGTLYDDQDSDGVLGEPGEPPLSGWTVYLDLDDSGTPDPGEPTAATGANGGYSFGGIDPGSNTVRVVPLSGAWTCSAPSPCERSVDVLSGDRSTGNDFGFWSPAGLGGTLYEDRDADGAPREPGEPPLEGWDVYLDLDASGSLDSGEPTETTDAGGAYAFPGLTPGSYAVRIELQADWTCSAPAPCGHDVPLSAGDQLYANDFGAWAPAELSGTLFDDVDADGAAREAGEPALAGWTVYTDLDRSGSLDPGEPADTTDTAGDYSFTGLKPGEFAVRSIPQGEFSCSYPAPCSRAGALESRQSLGGQDFGAAKPSGAVEPAVSKPKKKKPLQFVPADPNPGDPAADNAGSGDGGTLPFTGLTMGGMLMMGLGLVLLGRFLRLV